MSNPQGEKTSARRTKPSKRRKQKLRNTLINKSKNIFEPVNAIFVYNKGRTTVTLSRCEYSGDLGGKIGFDFEAQQAVSYFGDHLPKRLDPGQDAILIHDYKTMKAFLNEVMQDNDVDSAKFIAVLALGNGRKVAASPGFQIHAAAGPDITDVEYEVFRQEKPVPHFMVTPRWPFLRWR
jgi:hypothetical protein